MAKVVMVCRVCGKEYEACRSARITTESFRWQDVACSPECGSEYLRRIRLSRETNKKEPAQDDIETIAYSDDFYGFDDEPDESYMNGFGSDN